MKKIATNIPEVHIIEPRVFGDARGYFMETYSQKAFHDIGIDTTFVQDNQSFTGAVGTLRGIHFQNDPGAQAKLVRVTRGKVLDVAVDLRRGSPTYLQWVAVELSEENHRMLFIPRGFGHAFLTLTNDVEFLYKVDNAYNPSLDRSIRFDEPSIGIQWGTEEPVLSTKDQSAPFLAESDCNFKY